MLNYSIQTGFLCNQTLPANRNSSELPTVLIVISGINVALSITATLGNALIHVAFYKESSLNPPSKLFLRCLAFSDRCAASCGAFSFGSLLSSMERLSSHRTSMVFLQHSGCRFFTCNFVRNQRRQTSCAIVRHQV